MITETATQQQGTFSLTFSVAGDRKEHAVDWDLHFSGEWCHSRRAGVRWDCLGQIGEQERLVLISNFGLEMIRDQLPLETIRLTSPQALLLMRRGLEMEHSLPVLAIESDTVQATAPI